jgi:hypothetical protein
MTAASQSKPSNPRGERSECIQDRIAAWRGRNHRRPHYREYLSLARLVTGHRLRSAFGGGSGSLDAYVQAACAPLLSERGMWATVFIVLGVGLLISSVVVYRASQPSRMPLPTMTLSPPPGATKRGWYPDPAGTGKQRYWNGKIWSDLPPR